MERTELQLVSCSNCANFTPDAIGSGQGVGECSIIQSEKTEMNKRKRFIECGAKLCYNGNDKPNRFCQHYQHRTHHG